ncbi:hypothetical protein WEN_02980 [Mycoplasma wenyonii str. Massachusetts]|uniref:Uncharacterized protein n=1 Tax=Mycoplasma wenyonii (strain Massachusetts) TaxID=1197325 RepID=I6YM53_MYCWM|nr:hypothetical protein WEN_02980 [Mycoplasma wenyonii str. Massachusetts]
MLKNSNECWGLVVSSKKGEQEKVKWRRIKGSIEGETCKLEIGKKRKIFEDGKWKNEDNSVTLNR